MRKSIKKNFIFNLAYQMLLVVLPIITTPHVSLALRDDAIGAYSFSQSIVTYFILFGCIGLGLYGQREIAYHQDDRKKQSEIFWELVLLKVITMGISICAFLVTVRFLPQYQMLLYIQLIDLIANMIDVTFLFQGMEDFKKIVMRNTVARLIGVICIFTLVKSPEDLPIYTLIYSLSLFASNLSMWFSVPRLVDRVRFKDLDLRRHIRPSLVLFLPQIAITIYTVLNTTMIGIITTDAEVAYFVQAQKIVTLSLTFVTTLGTVMLPRISNLSANNDTEQIKKYMEGSLRFTFLIGIPIMFGLMGIAKNLIPWFLPGGFEKSEGILILIAPIVLLIGITNVIGVQLLLPTKRQKEFTISTIIGSIVNLLSNLILIPLFLSTGSAISRVIAELSVCIYQVYCVRNDISLLNILKKSWRYIIAGVAMFIVLYFLGLKLTPSIIHTAIMIVVGGCVYFSIILLLKDEFVIHSIKNILKRG